MKKIQNNSVEILTQQMKSFFDIQEYKDIISFSLEDIDLSDDVSAPLQRIDLQNYPYMIEPLKACVIQPNVRKEVVIALCQQMGKTAIQNIAVLYNSAFNVLQAIVCYPNQQLANETSNTKFIPLFKKVPQFKQDIEKPFAIRSDRLKLSNALIYWQSAASKVVSRSCKMVCGDQCAVWQPPPGVNNIEELKKRTRSFNECLQLFVSTPRYKSDTFWTQFIKGSQGFYYLRCQNCGKLTMRSSDVFNLQFETVYNEELKQYTAVRGSERLICPACRFEHTENMREAMIKQGGYLHKFPEKIKTFPTFQAGVLASLLNVNSWSNIGESQLASGKSATLEDYISFDTSIRGLPYQQRDFNKQDEAALSKHYYKSEQLNKDDVEAVIIAADTQDTFSVYAVIALTKSNNYYVLDMGRLRYMWLEDQERKIIDAENKRNGKAPEVTLSDLLDKQYCGLSPLCMLVDMRGHRSTEVKNFSRMRKNILLYGGTNLKYQKWKLSDNISKLFLCDARKYQAELLFMLYFQKQKETNYLFLPENISQQDVAEITSFQPDNEKRNGGELENYTPKDKVHDMFDTLKIGLACFQIASKIYRKDKFRYGEARILNRLERPKKESAQKQPARPKVQRKPLFRR